MPLSFPGYFTAEITPHCFSFPRLFDLGILGSCQRMIILDSVDVYEVDNKFMVEGKEVKRE